MSAPHAQRRLLKRTVRPHAKARNKPEVQRSERQERHREHAGMSLCTSADIFGAFLVLVKKHSMTSTGSGDQDQACVERVTYFLATMNLTTQVYLGVNDTKLPLPQKISLPPSLTLIHELEPKKLPARSLMIYRLQVPRRSPGG